MREVIFSVPGRPQGKARARTVINNGRVHTYTPDKTAEYEKLVKTIYRQASKGQMMDDGPIMVTITAVFEPPASVSKKQLEAMLDGRSFPQKKPDLDNILKIILDALNGVAYADDKNVIGVVGKKEYGMSARVEVKLEILEPEG